MQRPVIEDVLDVLLEIQKAQTGSSAQASAFNLRQMAVLAVASRELGKGRFANEPSAVHSIQDACSRRLGGKIADFDQAVEQFLVGDSTLLEVMLQPTPKNPEQQSAVEQLLSGAKSDSQGPSHSRSVPEEGGPTSQAYEMQAMRLSSRSVGGARLVS